MQPMSIASSSAPARRIALLILTFVSFTAPVLAYFWFVDHFGLNTIWIDQWGDLGIISHAYSGHLTLSTLWAQHTQNRIIFPNLIVLLLAYTTNFNVVDEEFLSATILVLSIALLIIGHRRRSPTTPWIVYSPVAILMLSVVQSGNTLWGFQFAWYLVLLALSVALVLCDSPKWNWFVTAGAISAAIVGSFSSLQGLLIWPAGLLILLLRNRPRRFVFTWIGAAAVTTAILHHPLEGVRFFLFSVGNVIGAHGNVSLALGFLIVLTSLWLIVSAVVRRQDDDATPLGVALICFGLLFALTITTGRAAAGLDAAEASRYTTFDLLMLVGCYLALLSRHGAKAPSRPRDRVLRLASWVTVGAVICLQATLGTINGLNDARSFHNTQIQASEVIVNIKKAPYSMIERVLVVNPYFVPSRLQLTRFAQTNHLSLFDSETAVKHYARAGLPYDVNSLVTAVFLIYPRHGANVKGIVYLDASASSDYGVTKVDFVVHGSKGSPLVAAAKHTDFGWLAGWNTVTLTDGRYSIKSVAYDASGHMTQSKAVVVEVDN
jgi:hypothetical protein